MCPLMFEMFSSVDVVLDFEHLFAQCLDWPHQHLQGGLVCDVEECWSEGVQLVEFVAAAFSGQTL